MFGDYYQGKRVLVTGHTGFKGAWLCHWLVRLGAQVDGLALEPEGERALFDDLKLSGRIGHHICDVRDQSAVAKVIAKTQPDVIFHLAAQALVRRSYAEPVQTYATNVMGTAHILEALRVSNLMCNIVIVTTDKCYENKEWLHSYRETDPMGGYDPYSSSKACAELVTSAYRQSFFSEGNRIRIASARAGNVIGGGDWAEDRIVPDAMRALEKGEVIHVRNRHATRPWQHVLEPLSGYMQLAAAMSADGADALRSSFNFGPTLDSNCNVATLVNTVLKYWSGSWKDMTDPLAPHEASLLNLAIDKAHHQLGWRPAWDFEESIAQTVGWYQQVINNRNPLDVTDEQISSYQEAAGDKEIAWST